MLTSSNPQPLRVAILLKGDKFMADTKNHPPADRSVLRIIKTLMPSRLDLREQVNNIKCLIRISALFKVDMAITVIKIMRMILTRRTT